MFDKKRAEAGGAQPSGPGSVFDRKPAGGPGSVFDRKPAGGPGSVFDKKGAEPKVTRFHNQHKIPGQGQKFGDASWTGPTAMPTQKKGAPKQSLTFLMMQNECEGANALGGATHVPSAFDQDKTERAKTQRVEDGPTYDKQLFGVVPGGGLENTKYDPFKEEVGPHRPEEVDKYDPKFPVAE